MERLISVPLVADTAQKILQANPGRKGFIVENLTADTTVSISIGAEPPSEEVAEVRLLTFSAVPSAGSFKLTYMGQETAAIAHDDDNTDVEAALQAIPGLSTVGVTGDFTSGFEITFDTGSPVRPEKLFVSSNTLSITGQDDTQKISFSGTPEIGSFKLTFIEQGENLLIKKTTTPIPWSISAANLQVFLRGFMNDSQLTCTGSFASGFTITFKSKRGDLKKLVVGENSLAAYTNATQVITFDDTPTAGTFKIKHGSEKTSALAYGASAGTIQTALRLLTGLSAVTVTGTIAGGLTITFLGLTSQDSLLEITDAETLVIAGSPEQQTIEFSDVPDAGNWKVQYNGQKTSALTSPTTNGQLQTALRTLVGLSGLTVSGNFTSGFTVTFVGSNTDFEALEIVEDNLTKSSNPVTVTVGDDDVEAVEDVPVTGAAERTVVAAYGAAVTTSVSKTQVGVEDQDVSGSIAVTTPGESLNNVFSVDGEEYLDSSDSENPGEVYALTEDDNVVLRVTEIL